MNKITLYTAGLLLGASLVACDDYKEPNPPAQSNTESSVLQASDVTVNKVVGDATYNLHDLYDAEQVINIATVACDKLAEGYTFAGNGYISVDNFETSFLVPMLSEKNEELNVWTLDIEPLQLNNVYRENITRMNDDAKLQFRFNLTTVYSNEQGNQVAIVGGPNNFYGPYDIIIAPIPEEKVVFDYLYTPGEANGWNQSESQLLYTLNGDLHYVEYKGFAVLENGYKYTSAADWNGINFGAGEEEGTLSTDGEAGNLTVAEKGLYYNFVDVDQLTYSTYLVNTIGLIGDFNDWSESEPLYSTDYLIWTGDVYLGAGGFKFRCNDEWVVDLGGSLDHLEFGTNGGGNISFDGEDGIYTVTLDLSKLPYTATIEKK